MATKPEPGPLGRLMLKFIGRQSQGRIGDAYSLRPEITELMSRTMARLVESQEVTPQEAWLHVMCNALDQVQRYSKNADIIARAASTKRLLIKQSQEQPQVRKRQSSSRAAAQRQPIGRAYAKASQTTQLIA